MRAFIKRGFEQYAFQVDASRLIGSGTSLNSVAHYWLRDNQPVDLIEQRGDAWVCESYDIDSKNYWYPNGIKTKVRFLIPKRFLDIQPPPLTWGELNALTSKRG